MESKLNSIIRNDWCFGKSCSRYPRSKKVKENHLKLPDIRWTVDGQLINIEVKSRNRPPWIYPMIQQTKCNYRLVNPITGETFCYVLEQSAMHQLAVHGIIPSDIIDLPDHKTIYLHEWFEQSTITTDIVAIIKKQQSYVFLLTQGAYDFFISRTYNKRRKINE